jgi:hypothetical protein
MIGTIGDALNDISWGIQTENLQTMAEIKEAYRLGDNDQVRAKLWDLADHEDKDFEPTNMSDRIRHIAGLL